MNDWREPISQPYQQLFLPGANAREGNNRTKRGGGGKLREGRSNDENATARGFSAETNPTRAEYVCPNTPNCANRDAPQSGHLRRER